MIVANSVANTEVEGTHEAGGLPQLDATTFEPQLAWLLLTFVLLYFVISRIALPKVTKVLENREERIADDLDAAERMRGESEEVKAVYEAMLAEARKSAHDTAIAAKEALQLSFKEAQDALEAKLSAEANAAEATIKAAKDEALKGLEDLAGDVTRELVAKLSGEAADSAVVDGAVTKAATNVKEA